MAGVGLEFAVAIALFGGIGWLLDRWLQTAPWLLILGVFLGFAAGLGIVIKLAKQMFHD
jgi:ATP synthase protein I